MQRNLLSKSLQLIENPPYRPEEPGKPLSYKRTTSLKIYNPIEPRRRNADLRRNKSDFSIRQRDIFDRAYRPKGD